jgi:hypothetical protein
MSSPREEISGKTFENVRANAQPCLPGLFSKADRLFSRSRYADRLGYAVVTLGIGSPYRRLLTAFSPQKRRKRPIGSPSLNVTLTLCASRSNSSRGLPGGGSRRSTSAPQAGPKSGRERRLDDMKDRAWFVPPFPELNARDYLRTTESASEYRRGSEAMVTQSMLRAPRRRRSRGSSPGPRRGRTSRLPRGSSSRPASRATRRPRSR